MYAPDERRRELDAGEVLRAVDAQHRRRVEQAARLGDDLVERATRRPSTRTAPAARSAGSAGPASTPILQRRQALRHHLGDALVRRARRARRSRGRRCGCRRGRRRARARDRATSVDDTASTRKRASLASRRGSAVASSGSGSGAVGQARAARASLLIASTTAGVARPQHDAAARRARAPSRARCRTRPRRRCRRCRRARALTTVDRPPARGCARCGSDSSRAASRR